MGEDLGMVFAGQHARAEHMVGVAVGVDDGRHRGGGDPAELLAHGRGGLRALHRVHDHDGTVAEQHHRVRQAVADRDVYSPGHLDDAARKREGLFGEAGRDIWG